MAHWFIVEQLSNMRFLVDTGASYSIFPHQSSSPPSGPRLRGVSWPPVYLEFPSGRHIFLNRWGRFFASFLAHGGSSVQHDGRQGQPAVVSNGVVTHGCFTLFAGGGVRSSCSTHSHRSTFTGQQSPVISHRSAGDSGLFLIPGSSGLGCSSHSHRSAITGQQAAAPAAALAALSEDSVEKLLADFPAVVNSSKTLPRRPSGDVEHHIVIKGRRMLVPLP
jgi:hypothetical protein